MYPKYYDTSVNNTGDLSGALPFFDPCRLRCAQYLCVVDIFLFFILAGCAGAILHTYLLYPWWVIWRAGQVDAGKGTSARFASALPEKGEEAKTGWPPVFVLMAVHNEAAVLPDKLDSLALQQYPGHLSFLIGSDKSTDATNEILRARELADDRFTTVFFTRRQGKPSIINQLAAKAGAEGVYVLTDASVMLRPGTITGLVTPMRTHPAVGVVDAIMVQTGAQLAGVGEAETAYISREVQIKKAESILWGAMVGPFGGCWAIRAVAFRPVPDNFLVDDFFLCMAAYEAGYQGVSSAAAIVEEGVGQSMEGEFRRKVRIGSGNWQNLCRFRALWWPCWRSPLAFAFFSHKVLRWWTPFFLVGGLLAWLGLIGVLGTENNYWPSLLLITLSGGLLLLVMFDWLLGRLGIHLRAARFVRYFLAMNLALLVGFYRFLNGIKTNVWQPSQRH